MCSSGKLKAFFSLSLILWAEKTPSVWLYFEHIHTQNKHTLSSISLCFFYLCFCSCSLPRVLSESEAIAVRADWGDWLRLSIIHQQIWQQINSSLKVLGMDGKLSFPLLSLSFFVAFPSRFVQSIARSRSIHLSHSPTSAHGEAIVPSPFLTEHKYPEPLEQLHHYLFQKKSLNKNLNCSV